MNVGVGQYIYRNLSLIDKSLKVFPVIADFNTADPVTPFAVYQRTSCSPDYTKDLFTGNIRHNYSVTIADNNYTNTVTLTERIINAMLALSHKDEKDMRFGQVLLVDLSEDFIDGIYTQTLQFEINTSSK